MPIIEGELDFRDEKDRKEAKEWSKERLEEWGNKLLDIEKDSINKLYNEKIKNDIFKYSKNLQFTTDVIIDREKEESDLALKENSKTIFSDMELLEKSIKKNSLEDTVRGYAKISLLDMGITFNIRESGFGISYEVANKVDKIISDRALKKFDFLEVSLNSDNIDSEIPLIVEVKIKAGENYGVIVDSKTEIANLLLENNLSIKTESLKIINILGREYLLANAEIVKENDFSNIKDITWGRDNYGDLETSLSKDQIEALSLYVKREYTNINSYLRTGIVPEGQEKDKLEKRINDISSALSFKPLPENIVLYRRVGQEAFGFGSTANNNKIVFDTPKFGEKQITIEDFTKEWLGKEYNDKAFMSTSLSSMDVTSFQEGRFIFRINALKGLNAAYVSGFDGFIGENEILLDKNTTFIIERISEIKELRLNRTEVTKVLIDVTAVQN